MMIDPEHPGNLVALGGLKPDGDAGLALEESGGNRVCGVKEPGRAALLDGLAAHRLPLHQHIKGPPPPFIVVKRDHQSQRLAGNRRQLK